MLKIIHQITLLLLLAIAALASAQTGKIAISGAFNANGEPATEAIVYLIAEDQSIAKTEITDENGRFAFVNIGKGRYALQMTQNGQTRYTGDLFDAQTDLDLGTIPIAAAQQLEAVTVTKTKQYIERHDGKTILNVESSIAATGSSAFEVIERAPGVNVDNNDNISLRGRGGIIVQIDGKPTPMTGANLANYLRGIPSGSIEKIEFITNPSSKYDAAGTSIINIRMKKDKRKGTNGSVSAAIGHGRYIKNNNNLSLNHRNEHVNIFGSYSFAYREGYNDLQLDRKFYDGTTFTGAFDQDNYLKLTFRNHTARAGMDYRINEKHTVGVLVSGVSNKFTPTGGNFSDVYDANAVKASFFRSQSHNRDHWRNYSANINYKWAIDTTGTEFTTDLDYASYGNTSDQNFDVHYGTYDASVAPLPYRVHGDLQGSLQIYAAKTDLVKHFGKTKFETGIKSSYVQTDNDLLYFDRSSGADVYDPTKSNRFLYKENINAAYANAAREFGKWNVQLGLRLENTNISGRQLAYNRSFDDAYLQLFPSALLTYAMHPKHSFDLNYSRRIQRPGYDQLNPFRFYIDHTTYKEGNPRLIAQTTHSFELTHAFNQKIFTTLSFSRTNDNITDTVSPSVSEAQVTVQSVNNLDSVDIFGLYFIVPVSVTKWWDTTNNINLYTAKYNGNVSNTPLSSAGNFTWNVSSNNNFKLGNGYFAELSGEYRARERYAYDHIEPIWLVNAGVQKKFNNSTLKLAMTDIFRSNIIKARLNYTGYEENFAVGRDSQVVTLSYTYNFGHGNGGARKRTGGADDIKQRAGGSNG